MGSRLFVWETSLNKVAMRVAGEQAAETEEFEQAPPVDPHGTLSAHMEISPTAVMDGAVRKFGFHGSEVSGKEDG